jgi:adenylate cyclase class IV
MHNVEFKAELRDLALAGAICRKLEAMHVGDIDQTDTYYRVPNGRLKKREAKGERTEYIFYDRPDRISPKLSHFTIYSEREALERFGRHPLAEWVVVRKKRHLYLLRGIRIHLDSVEGLGDFIEFEALVSPEQNVVNCHRQIAALRMEFAPVLGEAISSGYSDMLAAEQAQRAD